MTRKTKLLAAGLAAASMMALGGGASAQAAQTVTVAAGAPGSSPTDNSWPFGQGSPWGNNMGFIYKNIPAFTLKAGDTISFDTVLENEVVPQLEIGLAQTTVSGGDIPAAPFTPVVPNTNPPTGKGNTVVEDYDLAYKVATPYTFPGGGLIIKFTNRTAAFSSDVSSTQVFQDRQTTAADPSGQFAFRFGQDTDGAFPWSLQDTDRLSGFRLILEDPPASAKKKCKKKKKGKGKAAESAAKKKKCKKKGKKK